MMETIAKLVNADKVRVDYTEYELSAEVGKEVKRGEGVRVRGGHISPTTTSCTIFHTLSRLRGCRFIKKKKNTLVSDVWHVRPPTATNYFDILLLARTSSFHIGVSETCKTTEMHTWVRR